MTLIKYGYLLMNNGREADVQSLNLWTKDDNIMNGGSIAQDLDHILENSSEETCDLWEEIRSKDMFWNKFTMRRALKLGSEFANLMGDQTRAVKQQKKATDLEAELEKHWNGQ